MSESIDEPEMVAELVCCKLICESVVNSEPLPETDNEPAVNTVRAPTSDNFAPLATLTAGKVVVAELTFNPIVLAIFPLELEIVTDDELVNERVLDRPEIDKPTLVVVEDNIADAP